MWRYLKREILPDSGATICSLRRAHRSLGCSAKRNVGVLHDGALAYWQQRPTHGEMALIPIGPTAFAPTCVSIGHLRNCPQPDTHSSIPVQVLGLACCHSVKKQVHKDASILASRALTGRLRWLWSQLGSQSPLQLYKRCLSIFHKPLAMVRAFTHTHTPPLGFRALGF